MVGQRYYRSGPKGRRFKSCHLDQKPGGKAVFCPVFLMQTAQNNRILTDFWLFGRTRIATDFVGQCLVYGRSGHFGRHRRTEPKGRLG